MVHQLKKTKNYKMKVVKNCLDIQVHIEWCVCMISVSMCVIFQIELIHIVDAVPLNMCFV